jgi:hypothetical protein
VKTDKRHVPSGACERSAAAALAAGLRGGGCIYHVTGNEGWMRQAKGIFVSGSI